MLAFEILGPLVVRGDHGEIRIAGAKRRALAVRLLIAANELVPAGPLAEDLWEGSPPAGATATLQSHISQLRKLLGADRLVGRDGGYVLEVSPDELDVTLFERESRQGRDALAAGDATTAARLLTEGLGRWRGAALADANGAPWARPEQTRLEELHEGAIETWLEARLELGEHQEVVSQAEAALVDHPLREGIWGYLMLALYRSGRQSDALRAYQRVRKLLGEELGIEPSTQLVALDDAIVQQKSELEWSTSGVDKKEAWRWDKAGVSVTVPDGAGLPSGTVTLLFTDVVGSTRLWEAHPEEMASALARHDEILRAAVTDAGGHVFKTVGDAVCAAFTTPKQALAAAVAGQRALGAENWPEVILLEVRMGLHTGVCQERDGDYFGPTVNRAARLAATAHGGQIVTSGASAALLSDSLPEGVSLFDLGEHKLQDLGRPERVFQLLAVGLDREFPPLRSPTSAERRHNLPAATSSFVRRPAPVAEIGEKLASSRLVTLTGPGGAGKTRLALHLGAELVEERRDGVWFVDLAPVVDAAMVARTVARVLLVREEPDQPLEDTLAAALAERQMLLIFDNCEQVLDPCARLSDTLRSQCPELSILATSREPLAISGEVVVAVPSMTTAPEDVVDPVTIDGFEATRLFVERASAHKAEFRLDESNAAAVASICRRLDGIPLAIELAAVRVRSLTPDEIDARMGDRFRLLTGGSRAVAPRHQTLRSAIDWSYDLLTLTEQVAFARLSVFAGGWTLDAAEAVVAGDDVEHWEVLDLLSSLVDKSLIQCDSSASVSRYSMLETVHHYAAEQLSGRGQGDVNSSHLAHRHFFLSLAETGAQHFHGPRESEWLDRLELDHENLRTAFTGFLTDPISINDAMRLGVALHRFWLARGYNSEGTESLCAVLESPASGDIPALHGRVLYALGVLLARQGRNSEAKARFDEALMIARSIADLSLEALVLIAQSWIYFIQGDDGSELANEAVRAARSGNDARLVAAALQRRADVISMRNLEASRADYADALSYFQSAGDLSGMGVVLVNLGYLELQAGDLDIAKTHLAAALDILVESNRVDTLPDVFCNLGLVCLLQGDVSQSQSFFADALVAAHKSGMKDMVGYALLGVALCLSARDDTLLSATLHGFADALFELCGEPLLPLEGSLRENDQARLRNAMPGEGFSKAYASGRLLSLPEAVEAALAIVGSDSA